MIPIWYEVNIAFAFKTMMYMFVKNVYCSLRMFFAWMLLLGCLLSPALSSHWSFLIALGTLYPSAWVNLYSCRSWFERWWCVQNNGNDLNSDDCDCDDGVIIMIVTMIVIVIMIIVMMMVLIIIVVVVFAKWWWLRSDDSADSGGNSTDNYHDYGDDDNLNDISTIHCIVSRT